jgi:hypothetical protein
VRKADAGRRAPGFAALNPGYASVMPRPAGAVLLRPICGLR